MKKFCVLFLLCLSASAHATSVVCVSNCHIVQMRGGPTVTYTPIIANGATPAEALKNLETKCTRMGGPNAELLYVITKQSGGGQPVPKYDCTDLAE